MIRNNRTIAIPPGETIKELLQENGISKKEFSVKMSMSEKHISKLIITGRENPPFQWWDESPFT